MDDPLHGKLQSLRIERGEKKTSRRTGMGRLVVPLILVALVASAGFAAVKLLPSVATPKLFQQAVTLTEVSVVSPSQAKVTVTSTGYAIAQKTSKVGASSMGRLKSVLVSEGDVVKAGDVLAVLEDNDQRSGVAAASARVSVAQARVQLARAQLAEVSQEVARTRALVASGAVGRASLETLVAREKAFTEAAGGAQAEIGAAQADVARLGVGLKERVIVAPMDGTVVEKPAAVGELVGGPSTTSVIAVLVDFESLVIESDVPESKLHLITMGGPAEIVLDAYPNRRYRGVVYALGQRVNRAKATVVVKVKFTDPRDAVLPDMSARVSFLSKPLSEDELKDKPKKVVASDAVVERAGQQVVFTVEDGKAHLVPVKVGASRGATLELLDGPSAGTRVVARPPPGMGEGERVKETDR